MNKLYPLMQREWLQHRFGWLLMAGIPLGLAALLLAFGQMSIDGAALQRAGNGVPPLLAMAAIAGSGGVIFVIAVISSLIIVSGIARRDHADRSVEFWLSLPTSHSASLATPLLVHLLLVPAAALLAGMAGGALLSMIVVARVAGVGAWFTLPWGQLLPAVAAIAGRLLGGLPLAMLWLSPLILLVVLLSAWFRRWAWVIAGVGLGLGGQLLDRLFGQPLLADVTLGLLKHAGRALTSAGQGLNLSDGKGGDAIAALQAVPSWAFSDLGLALRELASPLLPGALLFAAGCFYLLTLWRRRGAGAGG